MNPGDFQIVEVRRLIPGLVAVGIYAANVWQWVGCRKPENILWACHLGCLLVGIGWLLAWPLVNAIGLLWLLPGILFWGLYLAGGGPFMWTSFWLHLGGNALGLWGAVVLGFPAGTWWQAGLAYAALTFLSRCVSRRSENVNFSIQVWPGWEARFPSYRRYLTGLILGGFALFFILEQLLRRFWPVTH